MRDIAEGLEYALAFRFDDQSPSYTLGFEAGQLSEMLKAKANITRHIVHPDNLPTLHRMAEYYGYSLIVDGTAIEGWCEITATPLPPKPKLMVV